MNLKQQEVPILLNERDVNNPQMQSQRPVRGGAGSCECCIGFQLEATTFLRSAPQCDDNYR